MMASMVVVYLPDVCDSAKVGCQIRLLTSVRNVHLKHVYPSCGFRGGGQRSHAPLPLLRLVIKKIAATCGALYFMFLAPPLTIVDPMLYPSGYPQPTLPVVFLNPQWKHCVLAHLRWISCSYQKWQNLDISASFQPHLGLPPLIGWKRSHDLGLILVSSLDVP